jgi:hypothetical protein
MKSKPASPKKAKTKANTKPTPPKKAKDTTTKTATPEMKKVGRHPDNDSFFDFLEICASTRLRMARQSSLTPTLTRTNPKLTWCKHQEEEGAWSIGSLFCDCLE